MTYLSDPWSARRWDSTRWAFRLFTVAGIRVYLQVFFLLLLLFETLSAISTQTVYHTWIMAGLLFLFVLLHEFGHCFGCRFVGGRADEILMWPLGGLAYCAPPDRPKEHLITTLAGPAVNLAICAALMPYLIWKGVSAIELLNPFADAYKLFLLVSWPVAVVFKINYWLFCFNIFLPLFPLDGGRILQALLWYRLGYTKSMWLAVHVGMFGSVFVGGVSLYHQNLWMFMIVCFCFFESWRMKRQLELQTMYGRENEFGYDFSEGYRSLERSSPVDERSTRPTRKSLSERFTEWKQQRQRKAEAAEAAEVDRILAKINEHGIASLTPREKKLLTQASERQRKRRG
jgi:Zn-dependent protease